MTLSTSQATRKHIKFSRKKLSTNLPPKNQLNNWSDYDFYEPDLRTFNEALCLREVNETETMQREDALSLEEIQFELPLIQEEIHYDITHTLH